MAAHYSIWSTKSVGVFGVDVQLLVSTEASAAIETLLFVPALPNLKQSRLHQAHPRSGLSLDTELSHKSTNPG